MGITETERLDWLICASSMDELAGDHDEFFGIPFGQSKAQYLKDIRTRIDKAIKNARNK